MIWVRHTIFFSWAPDGLFPGGGRPIVDFSRGGQKDVFWRRGNSGEISFSQVHN